MEGSIPYQILRVATKERAAERYTSTALHQLKFNGRNICLVVTVEIASPWHHASMYGAQIISALAREFSKSSSNSDLIKFEDSLKAVNGIVEKAGEKLQTTISCAVALINAEQVHVASIGNGSVMLFRSNKLLPVSSSKNDSQQFSEVTSGDVEIGETIIIANHDFAAYLSSQPELLGEENLDVVTTLLLEQSPTADRFNFCGTLLRFDPNTQTALKTINWDELESKPPLQLPKLSLPALPKLKFSLRQLPRLPKFRRPSFNLKVGSPHLPQAKLALPRRFSTVAALILVIAIIGGIGLFIQRIRASRVETKKLTFIEEVASNSIDNRLSFVSTALNSESFQQLSGEDKSRLVELMAEAQIKVIDSGTLLAEMKENIIALDTFENQIQVVDQGGQVWKIEGSSFPVKLEAVTAVPSPSDLTIINAERTVVTDTSGNSWLFDNSPTQPIALAQPSPIAQGNKLVEKFGKNLYLYSVATNEIYRTANFDKELGSPRAVIKKELLPATVVDLVVNGDFIVLAGDGRIISYRNGKQISEFSTNLSGDLSKARVSAHEKNPDILLLNDRGIIRYHDGQPILKGLLTYPDKAQEFLVEESGNLLIATGKKLYRTSF